MTVFVFSSTGFQQSKSHGFCVLGEKYVMFLSVIASLHYESACFCSSTLSKMIIIANFPNVWLVFFWQMASLVTFLNFGQRLASILCNLIQLPDFFINALFPGEFTKGLR